MRFAAVLLLCACGQPVGSSPTDPAVPGASLPFAAPLGATFVPGTDQAVFRLRAPHATRVQLELYDEAFGADPVQRLVLDREHDDVTWSVRARVEDSLYYGYRLWGPNWIYDPAWEPGSELGFIADIDADGHRFNPNKLLLDPYAREVSHDPTNARYTDYSVYRGDRDNRARNSGPVAPKGLVLRRLPESATAPPATALHDSIIYEVHVRGFTRSDPSVSEACRGTYAGAAQKADYLAELGVTAIELLPVHETNNDANDNVESAHGDNYWGYATLAFFAPDRRYACLKSPGGPTREIRAMVDAFHERGIQVFLDVVYNHTGEGGGSALLSWKGIDNPGYYELTESGQGYVSNTGAGPNTNAASAAFRDLVLDSLHYWTHEIGIDGYRFDLATVLGNGCDRGCFEWDPDDPEGILRRAPAELPRVALIAEPWAIGGGTYRLGQFPTGWAEWNDRYRDLVRQDQNRLDVEDVTMGWLANRITGSPELFGDDGRGPAASINFIVSHDGFTLRDLYSCNVKDNNQPWPFGPSSGGHDHNISWDHNGVESRQRQAVRTGLALLMLSQGVPMILGGDEMFRTQYCNNNTYNLDSDKNWLDWSLLEARPHLHTFARRIINFRRDHPALRNASYLVDEVQWLLPSGAPVDGPYMDDPANHAVAWRLDGAALQDSARSILVAYNGGNPTVRFHLPAAADGFAWYRVADTAAWMEPYSNIDPAGQELLMQGSIYDLDGRSLALFIER